MSSSADIIGGSTLFERDAHCLKKAAFVCLTILLRGYGIIQSMNDEAENSSNAQAV